MLAFRPLSADVMQHANTSDEESRRQCQTGTPNPKGRTMKRRTALMMALTTAIWLGFALPGDDAVAQQKSLKEQLVGTWTFVSSNAKLPDGSPLWGNNPKSLLIFTNNGYYTWHVFRSDRPQFASNNRMQGTPDENKATMQGSLAYFGTYSVNEGDKTVMFLVEGSTYPNSEGEELKRIITSLTTDELKYVNPATTLGARVEAVFRRAK